MALANANKDDDYLQTSGRHEKKENANENITNSQVSKGYPDAPSAAIDM